MAKGKDPVGRADLHRMVIRGLRQRLANEALPDSEARKLRAELRSSEEWLKTQGEELPK